MAGGEFRLGLGLGWGLGIVLDGDSDDDSDDDSDYDSDGNPEADLDASAPRLSGCLPSIRLPSGRAGLPLARSGAKQLP